MRNLEQSSEISGTKTEFQSRLEKRETGFGLTDSELQNLERDEIYKRLEAIVGNTPIRTIQLPNNNILIQKDETANPTETHYDRCYLFLLKKLEEEGVIKPGDTLLETTSGSAGVSFAWMCKKLGFKSVIFLPSFVPKPRIVEVQNLADEVHLSDDRDRYLSACAQEMILYLKANRERIKGAGHKIWMPNHSQNPSTPQAFAQIANEIYHQIDGGQIDTFVGGIGNGSTLLGIGERLKTLFPQLKVVAYEPMNACPYYKKYKARWGNVAPQFVADSKIPENYSFHDLPGTGGFGDIQFPFVDTAVESGVIDDVCPVPDKEILQIAARYNNELPTEMQQGNTSLVSRFVAEKLSENMTGKTILALAYDRADRYGEPKYIPETAK